MLLALRSLFETQHNLTSAICIASNSCSIDVITQIHILAVDDVSTANNASTDVITQIQVLTGNDSTNTNDSPTNVITQVQIFTGIDSSQSNILSTGIEVVPIDLTVDITSSANSCNTGEIYVCITQDFIGHNCLQVNSFNTGDVKFVQNLSTNDCINLQVSEAGQTYWIHSTFATPVIIQKNLSSKSGFVEEYLLIGNDTLQSNLSSFLTHTHITPLSQDTIDAIAEAVRLILQQELTWINELALKEGLVLDYPVTIKPSGLTVSNIVQKYNQVGDDTTVTRQ